MDIISQMLSRYETKDVVDEKNALKEVIQEAMLYALARAGFFHEAAFYGGTALRIFHGLDRFSEDLEFLLLKKNEDFTFKKYFSSLSSVLSSLGLDFTVEEKEKEIKTSEKTAFVKANARNLLKRFYPSSANRVPCNELIKIRFEVDVNPPDAFNSEFKTLLLPYPARIRLYDRPSLFAGKIHAILCRPWSRVKGRDLYDYLFFLSGKTRVNMENLKAKLASSAFLDNETILDRAMLISYLEERFRAISYEEAKSDVLPFIKEVSSLELWDADFFIDVTEEYLSD